MDDIEVKLGTIKQDLKLAKKQVRELSKALHDERQLSKWLDAVFRATRNKLGNTVIAPRGKLRIKKDTRRTAVAVMVTSDQHIEKVILAKRVNNLNTYNPVIAEARFIRMFQAFAARIRQESTTFDVRHALIANIGDLIEGYIHDELVATNAFSPTNAIKFGYTLWCTGLDWLCAEFPEMQFTVAWQRGNHGRTTARQHIGAMHDTSYEMLLGHLLAERYLSSLQVQFRLAESEILMVDIFNFRHAFAHGDAFKFAGGVGGVTVPLLRWVGKISKAQRFDYLAIGHWHQLAMVENVIVNGSLCGYDPYALHIGAPNEPAQQASYFIDSERGLCVFSPLWVTPTAAPPYAETDASIAKLPDNWPRIYALTDQTRFNGRGFF